MLKTMALVSLVLVVLQAPQQPPTIKSGTAVVTVDAVVLDGDGKVMTGLTAGDFTVFEDGKPMPVTTFLAPVGQDAGQTSRLVVLLLDDYSSARGVRLATMKAMAYRFIDKMGPKDVLAVVPLNGGHATTSTNPEDGRKALEHFRPNPPSIIPQSSARELALKALKDLSKQLEDVKQTRKTLVCLCAPSLFAAPAGSRVTENVWLDASRAAARANASLYFIDPNGLVGPSNRLYDESISLAKETGGAAFVNTNFRDRSVDQIWDEAGHYYLLGYVAPPPNGKKDHSIEVKVKRSDTEVRARRARS
jgi:VWFA-related protein